MPVGPPTPAAHGTPAGFKMPDGFATFITFTTATTIGLWEKQVQPPSIDGGEPTDTSTMHNTRWHTKHPRILIDMGPAQAQCAYDPNSYTMILAHVNVGDVVTVTFPDGGTLAFYGFIQKFEPEALKEGEMPMANVTVVVTNQDAAGMEQSPVYTAGTGTA